MSGTAARPELGGFARLAVDRRRRVCEPVGSGVVAVAEQPGRSVLPRSVRAVAVEPAFALIHPGLEQPVPELPVRPPRLNNFWRWDAEQPHLRSPERLAVDRVVRQRHANGALTYPGVQLAEGHVSRGR
jgi:hypothetical protein